jgi:predicted ATPase
MPLLNKLSISGFKSIEQLNEFELDRLNVFIGGNGAGKSNFVEMFRLLRAMVDQRLGGYILDRGGADDFLFNGPKHTNQITASFEFGQNAYRFKLKPTVSEKFIIEIEEQKYDAGSWRVITKNEFESQLINKKDEQGLTAKRGVGYYVYEALSSWVVYHFHDTSSTAPMRRSEIIEDNRQLRDDAANIAPFLLKLKNNFPLHYQDIVETIRLVMPFFHDFLLEPFMQGDKEKVKLSWLQKASDYPMQPYHFSDGSIRFICLAVALLQPNPPTTIVIDEPELGLHPYAIELLAEMIEAASQRTQVIISTQSPALVDYFLPEQIIVVNRHQGASTFERLDANSLTSWLEDYSLGELWRKNVIVGGPSHE